jgi:hypothetical protein
MEHSCIFRSQTRALRGDRDGREFEKKSCTAFVLSLVAFTDGCRCTDLGARMLLRGPRAPAQAVQRVDGGCG